MSRLPKKQKFNLNQQGEENYFLQNDFQNQNFSQTDRAHYRLQRSHQSEHMNTGSKERSIQKHYYDSKEFLQESIAENEMLNNKIHIQIPKTSLNSPKNNGNSMQVKVSNSQSKIKQNIQQSAIFNYKMLQMKYNKLKQDFQQAQFLIQDFQSQLFQKQQEFDEYEQNVQETIYQKDKLYKKQLKAVYELQQRNEFLQDQLRKNKSNLNKIKNQLTISSKKSKEVFNNFFDTSNKQKSNTYHGNTQHSNFLREKEFQTNLNSPEGSKQIIQENNINYKYHENDVQEVESFQKQTESSIQNIKSVQSIQQSHVNVTEIQNNQVNFMQKQIDDLKQQNVLLSNYFNAFQNNQVQQSQQYQLQQLQQLQMMQKQFNSSNINNLVQSRNFVSPTQSYQVPTTQFFHAPIDQTSAKFNATNSILQPIPQESNSDFTTIRNLPQSQEDNQHNIQNIQQAILQQSQNEQNSQISALQNTINQLVQTVSNLQQNQNQVNTSAQKPLNNINHYQSLIVPVTQSSKFKTQISNISQSCRVIDDLAFESANSQTITIDALSMTEEETICIWQNTTSCSDNNDEENNEMKEILTQVASRVLVLREKKINSNLYYKYEQKIQNDYCYEKEYQEIMQQLKKKPDMENLSFFSMTDEQLLNELKEKMCHLDSVFQKQLNNLRFNQQKRNTMLKVNNREDDN